MQFDLKRSAGIEPRAAYDTRIATMKPEFGKIFCQPDAFVRFYVRHFSTSSFKSSFRGGGAARRLRLIKNSFDPESANAALIPYFNHIAQS